MVTKSKQNSTDPALLDVDTRFLLANERTFLAWIRTALTIMVGGLALTQLGEGSSGHFGVLAVLFGAFTAGVGYTRYLAADRSIRVNQLPVHGRGPVYQVIGIAVLAIVVVALELLD